MTLATRVVRERPTGCIVVSGLTACPIPFDEIPRAAWDRLLACTPSATPFSRWTLHRAWWDAYGSTAHEQYLCVVPEGTPTDRSLDPDVIRAIVPLMHRHQVEPEDAATHTCLRPASRPCDGVHADAKTVFMGASYHADYATILVDPVDLPDVARALVGSLAAPPDPDHGDRDWDVVDLRRWRQGDPALHALAMAFRDAKALNDWTVALNAEDVCPIVTLPEDGGWDDYLATLEKKARHEIRRKIRRAEREGEIVFTSVEPTPENVEAFITLHQARWGDQGLFPQTEGGQRSRHFFHRIAELESAEGVNRQLEFGRVTVGGLLIFATVAFDDGATSYFYNAGMDPEALDLSPGVTGTAAYLKDRIDAGRRRFDFLRGNEPYKYEWGAVDEPIYRLLVTRS